MTRSVKTLAFPRGAWEREKMFTALDRRQGATEYQRAQLPPEFITYCFGGAEHGKLPWVQKTQCQDEHGRWAMRILQWCPK